MDPPGEVVEGGVPGDGVHHQGVQVAALVHRPHQLQGEVLSIHFTKHLILATLNQTKLCNEKFVGQNYQF